MFYSIIKYGTVVKYLSEAKINELRLNCWSQLGFIMYSTYSQSCRQPKAEENF